MSTESRPRQTAKAVPPKAPPAKAKTARAAKPAPAKATLAKATLAKATLAKAALAKGQAGKGRVVTDALAKPKATAAGTAAKVATPETRKTALNSSAPKAPAAKAAQQISPAKAAVAAKVSPAKAATKSVTASAPKAAKTVSVKAAMSVKSSASKSSVKAAESAVAVEQPVAEKTVAEKPAKAKPAAAKAAAVQAVTSAPVADAAVDKDAAHKASAKVVALKPADKEVFQPDDYVVYPTHGVGRILKIEKQEISGISLELFVIEFDKDKMTLRVPLAKVRQVGMRRLSTPQKMKAALDTLKGRARVKRTMWSRRAQEYEAKINSGDPVSIAEVVRDLHRNAGQPDQSYSERQIYEAALDRLARELAAVERIDEDAATKRLEKLMKAA
ncbi:MAG: CarD family transcriptional regulator [Alphaproteobacteria bacterium]|jgi:CarD family transcriptional regulator|nr:CarD family transcriptional regulator [Alphaproteobacteria bacterium]